MLKYRIMNQFGSASNVEVHHALTGPGVDELVAAGWRFDLLSASDTCFYCGQPATHMRFVEDVYTYSVCALHGLAGRLYPGMSHSHKNGKMYRFLPMTND